METSNHREKSAKYYAIDPTHPKDLDFYKERINTDSTKVLELGCGTGRVLAPLAPHCAYIHGIDLSDAMLDHCREKLEAQHINTDRARVEVGDITDLSLNQLFDLITAPFRVLQNLKSTDQVDSFFKVIKRHLNASGRAIVNVRNPTWTREHLIKHWCNDEDEFCWELETDEGTVKHYYRRPSLQEQPLVLFPELVYRVYQNEKMVDETVLPICQHIFFPDQFINLIKSHGFEIRDTWGGYEGEPYGEGDMLIVEFGHES